MRRRASLLAACAVALALISATVPAGHGPVAASASGWVVDRVRFEPLDPSAPLGIEGVGDYRGAVEVAAVGGAVGVVNEIALEDYVRGISEVPTRWPIEAQKAQAIAARTYALHEMRRTVNTASRALGAHLCATQACQVYAGLAKERREGSEGWAAAVEATRGQVLLFGGEPILAKYSSSNGGVSVPGGKPYLRTVSDPDDVASPHHRWQLTIPLTDLAVLFSLPAPAVGAVRQGDTVVIGWQAEDGTAGQHHVGAAAFRAAVNAAIPPSGLPQTLPSARYSLWTEGDRAVIVGRGWGHGVGMSQYGALGKALRGMSAADILASYYGGIRPVTLAPEHLPATIRVAVDLGRSRARVAAAGPFRVLDGGGRPLAVVASGAWDVVPSGGGVRVVPPADQASPPGLDAVGFDPATPRVGAPLAVRLRLSAPAALSFTVQPATGDPVVVDGGIAGGGEVARALPMPMKAGDHTITVHAVAGVDRVTSVAVPVRITPSAQAIPPAEALAAPGLTGGFGSGVEAVGWSAAAAALLLAAAAGTALSVRRGGGLRALSIH